MADRSPSSVVTSCKLTIDNKVSTTDGRLYKLVTDKHHFKIISFDPLVIEKDNPSQQDIIQLFDDLQVYSENSGTKHETLNKEMIVNINDTTSNFEAEVAKDTSISLIPDRSETFYSLKDESCNNQMDEILLGSKHKILSTEEQVQQLGSKHKILSTEEQDQELGSKHKILSTEEQVQQLGSKHKILSTEEQDQQIGSKHRILSTEEQVQQLGSKHRILSTEEHVQQLGSKHRILSTEEQDQQIGSKHRILSTEEQVQQLGSKHRILSTEEHVQQLGSKHRILSTEEQDQQLGSKHRILSTEEQVQQLGSKHKILSTEEQDQQIGSKHRILSTEEQVQQLGSKHRILSTEEQVQQIGSKHRILSTEEQVQQIGSKHRILSTEEQVQQIGSKHRILSTEEQVQQISENVELTNFKHKMNLDNNRVELMADTGKSEQEGGKYENNMQATVQTLSKQHLSQKTIEGCESDEESQEICVFSMDASSFQIAMYYFMKSCFRCYFEHAETDGTIFTFKLNSHLKEDLKFLEKIKQLEFQKYEFVSEDREYVRSAIETVMSEVSLLTLNIIGNSIHIIGSKDTVTSASKKLDLLLKDQGSNTSLTSEDLHKKNKSVVKGLEKANPCYGYSDRQEKDISENENTRRVIKSKESQYPFVHSETPKLYSSGCEQDVNLLSLHEVSNDSETSDYRLTHSEDNTSNVYSHAQNDSCIVTEICKLEVKIYKANIVLIKVDCIVNTTNKFLVHFGGVAKAIEEAAGAALSQECKSFINAGHFVEVTNIFVSTGGKLPVKFVMHAVGPEWDMYEERNKSQCLDDLRHTVMRCLFEADRRGLTSIALPSISAAICGVPKKLSAKCYMDAVKHFDAFIAGGNTSLREIHFVDVNDAMVALIRECFRSNLSRPCDQEILQKDHDFVKNHIYSASQIETASLAEKAIYHLKYKKNTFSDYHMPSSLTRVKKEIEMAVSAPLKAEKYEMSATYNLGKVTLKVDSRFALDQRSDIIITVGKPFDNLSSIPDFKILSHLKQSEVLSKQENIFQFFDITDSNGAHLLCEVYPEPENTDMITEALTNLESAINLQNIKELVLTSSILYANPTNKEQQKGNMSIVDRKKVGKFAQCLYSYLDKINNEVQNNICVTVAGSEDALLTLKKVIESYNVQKTASEDAVVQPSVSTKSTLPKFSFRVNSDMDDETNVSQVNVDKPVRPGIMCEFCFEKTSCLPVVCCRKLFCLKCKQSASSCPFCNTFWRILTGDQPRGSMKVSQINDHADGYEKVNVWKIDYYFPTGRQEKCHPSPGKVYNSVTRTAYLPANIHGLQVLMLLRISFIRKLTFTIGHSLKRNRDDVIIWNDISHKTSLHGEAYGYPDPKYLDQVTVELSNKGVRLDTLTETERLELAKFRSSITNYKSFSDNYPLSN